MRNQQYVVNQYSIENILNWIQTNEIAIPEIQRPFVWDSTQVRDFIDSLYRGYPVGYLIIWRNPEIKLRDGAISKGKKILIDGQQRITALMAAILGKKIVDKKYQKKTITIAFHPIYEKFEVTNSVIKKDKFWIPDISIFFSKEFNFRNFLKRYYLINKIDNEKDEDKIFDSFVSLQNIVNNSLGVIELHDNLDIDTVTEIFIRINSKGVELSQADFAMSKIAVNENYNGNILRKAIDYFSHLSVYPSFYSQIEKNDKEFANSDFYKKMRWLENDKDDLYNPSYTDILRVAFTYKFKRGKLKDLVALLSGRNFETKNYEEYIAEKSFKLLSEGVEQYINETNFKRFIMILRSGGFISHNLIPSQNAINFAYVLFLTLKAQRTNNYTIERFVRRWFVLSMLTSRYSGSPETQFDHDIRQIEAIGAEKYINEVVRAELSQDFWDISLPQKMNASSANHPIFKVFLAAQVKMKDKGFLSRDITVEDLIKVKGDVHHIFPKDFLKKQNYKRGMYNQIANYVMTQSEINISIKAKPPKEYFREVFEQINTGRLKYGGINSLEELKNNLAMNCIPENIIDMSYEEFLEKRRQLMAQKIKNFFMQL